MSIDPTCSFFSHRMLGLPVEANALKRHLKLIKAGRSEVFMKVTSNIFTPTHISEIYVLAQ